MLLKWIAISLNQERVERHQKFCIPQAQEFCDELSQ